MRTADLAARVRECIGVREYPARDMSPYTALALLEERAAANADVPAFGTQLRFARAVIRDWRSKHHSKRELTKALRFWVDRADYFEEALPPEKRYRRACGVGNESYALGRRLHPSRRPRRLAELDEKGAA